VAHIPEESQDDDQASYIDVLCFNIVACGGGEVTTSLGSCCWAFIAVCGWVAALQIAWLCFPTSPDLMADRATVCLPYFPHAIAPSSMMLTQLLCLTNLVVWVHGMKCRRHEWQKKSDLIPCCFLLAFRSCIYDLGAGGGTGLVLCREASWEAHILRIYEARAVSAVCTLGRW